MRPTTLIPGRKYWSKDFGGKNRAYTFIRRERLRAGQPAVNIFQCDDFRGLYGPEDSGITHLTDYQVCKSITGLAA